MESFWKDKSKRLIDPELFAGRADALAKRIQSEATNKANKPTQIRKFYDEIVRFDSILKTNPDDFEAVLPYLKMLNAKAAYAMGRDLISDSFRRFISDSLVQVKDRDDFEAFAGFFEAFMGFYKFYVEKGEQSWQGGGQ